MKVLGATILAAALTLGAPLAFAQSSGNGTTMGGAKMGGSTQQGGAATKMPQAGDASTGSSGGGNSGVDTTGSTTHNSNCTDVRANPAKYSADIIAGCR
ncbi:MAG: hypothetical protein U1E62_10465 [Alsobacter sp.]